MIPLLSDSLNSSVSELKPFLARYTLIIPLLQVSTVKRVTHLEPIPFYFLRIPGNPISHSKRVDFPNLNYYY